MVEDAPGSSAVETPIDLLAIVVNYRTPNLTLECVRSLVEAREEVVRLHVVVVENGSRDGSAERIGRALSHEGLDSWASLECLAENLGFAGGVNHGYRTGPSARWILLLNSDARLHPGTLQYCCRTLEADPTIGVLSCLVENEDGSVQNVARRFPTPLRLCAQALGLPRRFPSLFEWAETDDTGWDRRKTRRDVDWLGGAFMMLRGDLVERIGLMDEDFFFYGEDIELCHRIHRAGYRCHYDPSVAVTHAGAASPDVSGASLRWREQQLWSARYGVLRKCHGRMAEVFVRAVDLLTVWGRSVLRTLRFGEASDSARRERELLRLLRDLPAAGDYSRRSITSRKKSA